MASVAELMVSRRGTQALIQEDPVSITITRQVKVKNERGGADRGTQVLEPQTVRILNEDLLHEVNAPASISSSRVTKYRDAVLGLHTADFEVDDVFEAEGKKYRISSVTRSRVRVIGNIEAQS